MSDTSSRLAIAGVVAILLFATIGQLSHDHHVSVGGYAADALPLIAAWVVFALATGRFLATWLCAVTIGVAVRMAVLGHYRWDELAFFAVALVFIGVVAWPTWRVIERV